MSYLVEPVLTKIDKEIEYILGKNGIEISAISLNHGRRRLAYKLSASQAGDSLNSNFETFTKALKEACEALEKRNPKKHKKDKLYDDLLGNALEIGIFKEFKDRDLAEKLI